MDFAFTWIEQNGGLSTEIKYPYEAIQGTCDVDKRDRPVVSIDGHEDVPVNDEIALMKVRMAWYGATCLLPGNVWLRLRCFA